MATGARVIRAVAIWMPLATAVRLGTLAGFGQSLTEDGDWLLVRLAIANGFASDLLSLLLFVGPFLVIAHFGSKGSSSLARATAAGPHVALGLLVLLLACNVASFRHTDSALSFRVIALAWDPHMAPSLIRSAGGVIPLIAMVAALGALPFGLDLCLRRFVTRSPAPRVAISASMLAVLLAFYAGRGLFAGAVERYPIRLQHLMIQEFQDPAWGLVVNAARSDAKTVAPSVLGSVEIGRLRRLMIPDALPPESSDTYPLFRTWKPVGPVVIPHARSDVRPNLVLIFLESTGTHDLGAFGDPAGLTPHFDGLARDGLLFTRFFSNGTNSGAGLFSTLLSAYGNFGDQRPLGRHDGRGSLPGILADEGYTSAFISCWNLEWKGVPGITRHFDRVVDWSSLPPNDYACSDDRVIFDHAGKWLESAPPHPFFLTIFTGTHHHPWTLPGPPGADAEAKSMTEYQRARASLRYQDAALGEFLDRMPAAARKNTVLVVLGDHGSRLVENGTSNVGAVTEENIHIPLLIHAPGMLKPGTSDLLGSQVDVAPTLLDFLGIHEAETSFVGRSLLRGGQRRAFVTAPYGHGHLALLNEEWKVAYDSYFDRTSAFRVGTDEPAPIDGREREVAMLAEEALLLNRYATFLVEQDRISPPSDSTVPE